MEILGKRRFLCRAEEGGGVKNGGVGCEPRQEAGEIVGDVIHMRVFAALQLPLLAEDLAGAFRHHQHRGHAERMRDAEIAGEILEHRGLARIDVVAREEAVIGLRRGLRLELGRDDVEYVLEMVTDGETLHHGVGMLARAVGENELAARQFLDRGAERGIGLERRMIDLVHEIEIIVRRPCRARSSVPRIEVP